MIQRKAMLGAAALTAVALVLVGGLAGHLVRPGTPATAIAPRVGQAAAAAPISPGVTTEAAATIALRAMPGGQLVGTPELVDFEGVAAYEVVLDHGPVYVDATTGTVLFNGAAPLAAAASAPGGSRSLMATDDDDHGSAAHAEHGGEEADEGDDDD